MINLKNNKDLTLLSNQIFQSHCYTMLWYEVRARVRARPEAQPHDGRVRLPGLSREWRLQWCPRLLAMAKLAWKSNATMGTSRDWVEEHLMIDAPTFPWLHTVPMYGYKWHRSDSDPFNRQNPEVSRYWKTDSFNNDPSSQFFTNCS